MSLERTLEYRVAELKREIVAEENRLGLYQEQVRLSEQIIEKAKERVEETQLELDKVQTHQDHGATSEI